MSILLHGDCLEEMKELDDNSIDLIFCDLPYNQTSCKWDQTVLDLEQFWLQVMRIKKTNTPIFMTTTTKFGVSLIQSAPKKCPFRYDLVWVKSAPAGFLSAKKMPMRKHEMVYVFYEKLPLYDLSSHKHKFIDKDKSVVKQEPEPEPQENYETCDKPERNTMYGNMKIYEPKRRGEPRYDPPLPVSVVKQEPEPEPEPISYVNRRGPVSLKKSDIYGKDLKITTHYEDENGKRINTPSHHYDPPLPVSVVKEEPEHKWVKTKKDSTYGEVNTEDSKECGGHQQRYNPPLPVSVVKEDLYGQTCDMKNNYEESVGMNKKERKEVRYDPPLPTTMLEIKSTRGKHSTEKPVALMSWILKYFSKEGDVVLDPTMGSGSTGVACKEMNRNFIGIEMDTEIYESAVNRIED